MLVHGKQRGRSLRSREGQLQTDQGKGRIRFIGISKVEISRCTKGSVGLCKESDKRVGKENKQKKSKKETGLTRIRTEDLPLTRRAQ